MSRWEASIFGEYMRRSDQLDMGVTALALGAQEVLCTAPLLVSLSALMMHFRMGFVGGFLTDLLGLNHDASRQVNALFRPTRWPGSLSLILGLAVTAMFYIAVASTTQRCVHSVWGKAEGGLTSLRHRVTWVCVQLPGFSLALYVGHFLHRMHLPTPLANATYALALGVSVSLFHWWGHHLFLGRSVSWGSLLPGSLVIGGSAALLTAVSPLFMSSQILENAENYGLIGVAFVLSLWAVTYSGIVVYGTLAGKVWMDRRRRDGADNIFEYVP